MIYARLEVEVIVHEIVAGVRDEEPDKLTLKYNQFARGCPAARRPPISPDVRVMGKTAARVRISQRDTKSTGFPAERLVVASTSFRFATYELMPIATLASGAD